MIGAEVGLRVGEVALRTGIKPDTVRYYEDAGLLAPADRSHSGYRQFAEDAVERIRFIKRAQGLGFTLEEIAGLLELRVRHDSACAPPQAKADAEYQVDFSGSVRAIWRGSIYKLEALVNQ